MAYKKFKETVWAKTMQIERERVMVFARDCNREYEGEVKEIGDVVTIKGAGQVSVRKSTTGEQSAFDDPEQINGTDAKMPINCIADFHFMVKDIDKAQGAKGAIDIYTRQASLKMANEIDADIAALAADDQALKDNASAVKITEDNVLTTIDGGIQGLWERDVPQNEYLVLTVSPRFYMILKRKYQALDTNNSEMLKRGAVAMYGNVDIKLTNNCYTANAGAEDLIILRTKQAIAHVEPFTKIEGYRNHKYMSDAVQGAVLYDQKIVKPKELIVLNCKYA